MESVTLTGNSQKAETSGQGVKRTCVSFSVPNTHGGIGHRQQCECISGAMPWGWSPCWRTLNPECPIISMYHETWSFWFPPPLWPLEYRKPFPSQRQYQSHMVFHSPQAWMPRDATVLQNTILMILNEKMRNLGDIKMVLRKRKDEGGAGGGGEQWIHCLELEPRDLGLSFPDYPVSQCFLWVPSVDRGNSRRGGANIVFIFHNAEHPHRTDTQFMTTINKVYYLFLHTTPREFSQDSLLSLKGLRTFTVGRESFAPFSSSSNHWKPAGLWAIQKSWARD